MIAEKGRISISQGWEHLLFIQYKVSSETLYAKTANMNSIGCNYVFVHIIVTYMLTMTPQKRGFQSEWGKGFGRNWRVGLGGGKRRG